MAFDTSKRDAQATEIIPVKAEKFDLDAYADYEKQLLEQTGTFFDSESGVAVYRRIRSAEVFADGSRDMKRSLELQLGCLEKSMEFKADIPNFLEPWYGIGASAAAFGCEYVWNEGQAPAIHPQFMTTEEAVKYAPKPIADTSIGKHTLNMIDYFLTETKGKLPLSFSDAQSPLNASTMIVNNTNLFMDILIDPETVKQFFNILAELTIDFIHEQRKLIGNCLVNPGHGFASARNFYGYGQSDDNIVMISNEQYIECALPSFEKIGSKFGGPVFHSCGNWSDKILAVRSINGLRMIDGAFSNETDPDPNPAGPFVESFVDSGVIVNARIVGNPELIGKTVRRLWKPGMKLIVVTYCPTPEEQQEAYDLIHDICK
jgi:hypothetical protein